MPFPPPPPFEVVYDVRSTTWIDGRLMRRDGRDRGWLVGEVVPSGFEAYARIFHPARVRVTRKGGPEEWAPLRWAEIAAHRGKVAHPRMQIESLIGNPDAFDYEHWRTLGGDQEWFPPYETLEESECLALAQILRAFTDSSRPVWFWLWDGYGDMSEEEIRAVPRAMIYPGEPIWLPGVEPPRLAQSAFRHYLVFRGTLPGLPTWFRWRSESPNYWYPDDRAWIVATEIDGFSTFVGGTRSAIEATLASPLLELLPCELSDRHDAWGDEVNGDPRPPETRW